MLETAGRILAAGSVALAVAAPLGAVPAAAAESANWITGYTRQPDDGDAGGVTVSEFAQKKRGDGQLVSARFAAKGETLKIYDSHANGHPAVARLWVGGGDPAVFKGQEGGSRTIPLSYDEGQAVYLQVCTSYSDRAVCTEKKREPGRT